MHPQRRRVERPDMASSAHPQAKEFEDAMAHIHPAAWPPLPIDQKANYATTYDKLADIYEQEWANGETVKYQNIKEITKLFKEHGIDSGLILDLACGPGNLKSSLGEGFEYIGVDISPEMCKVAEANGYIDTINESLDLMISAFPDDSVDYVIASSVLYSLPPEKCQAVLREMERVATKGILFSLEGIAPLQDKMRSLSSLESYDHSNMDITETLGSNKVRPITGELIPTQTENHLLPEAWVSPNTGIRISANIIARWFGDSKAETKNFHDLGETIKSPSSNWDKVLTSWEPDRFQLKEDEWGLDHTSLYLLERRNIQRDRDPIDTRKHPEIIDKELRWVLEPINNLPFVKVIGGNPGSAPERIDHDAKLLEEGGYPEDAETLREKTLPYSVGRLSLAFDSQDPRSQVFFDKIDAALSDYHHTDRDARLDFQVLTGTAKGMLPVWEFRFWITPPTDQKPFDYFREHSTENRAVIQTLLSKIVEVAERTSAGI